MVSFVGSGHHEILVEVDSGTWEEEIVLDLSDSAGSVVDSSGAPVVDARVALRSTTESLSQVVFTDETGGFLARELPAGAYAVLIEVDSSPRYAGQLQLPADGLEIALEDGVDLRGTVALEGRGEPLADFGVTLELAGNLARVALETRTDAQGQFVLSGVPRGIHHLVIASASAPGPLMVHKSELRVRVECEETRDLGTLEYPSHPAGELSLYFEPAEGAEPAGEVEVRVARCLRGGFQMPGFRKTKPSTPWFTENGQLQLRLRQGTYRFLCR